MFAYFSFTDSAPTDIYTLSLHDALPICPDSRGESKRSLTVSELSMMQRYSDKPDCETSPPLSRCSAPVYAGSAGDCPSVTTVMWYYLFVIIFYIYSDYFSFS